MNDVTSTRILKGLLDGVRTGTWTDTIAAEFDAKYRGYLMRYLNSRGCAYCNCEPELKEEMISQTFAMLFKYLRDNLGWTRKREGSFRCLLKMVLTCGAAQTVLRQNVPTRKVRDANAPGGFVRVKREVRLDDILETSGDESVVMPLSRSRIDRKEEEELARANLSIYSLGLLNVLAQFSERDGYIIWDSVVNRMRHADVGIKYGVKANNVDQIVHRAFKRVEDEVRRMRSELLFSVGVEWKVALKKLWKEYERKNGPVRSMMLERSFAAALEKWEKEAEK